MLNKSLIFAAALPLTLAACTSDSVGALQSDLTRFDSPVVPLVFWATDDGSPITEATPDDALVSKNLVMSGGFAPLYDTDGERLTWGEARTATGRLKVQCQGAATRVEIKAEGLRPNGVYTAWLAFFQPPGFPVSGLGAITAISPVGPPDGSESVLLADEDGNARLRADVPAAQATVPLGAEQAIPSCLLATYELHIVLAYHQDGNTCGDNPCAEDTFVEQAAWIVTQGGVVAAE